jgi:hypothetical protein
VTVERDSHPEKHSLPSPSTDEGMQIDESDEQFQNVDSSIDESLEPDSNVTDKELNTICHRSEYKVDVGECDSSEMGFVASHFLEIDQEELRTLQVSIL